MSLSPTAAGWLADLILLLHALIVLFVVLLPPLIWIGGWRGWWLARSGSLRLLHLLTIGFVVLQSWLGQTCPLTLWESALRVQAGGQGYQRGMIEDWVGRCLFYNAPPAVFVLIYSGFAALVIWTWWRWPPRGRSGQ